MKDITFSKHTCHFTRAETEGLPVQRLDCLPHLLFRNCHLPDFLRANRVKGLLKRQIDPGHHSISSEAFVRASACSTPWGLLWCLSQPLSAAPYKRHCTPVPRPSFRPQTPALDYSDASEAFIRQRS